MERCNRSAPKRGTMKLDCVRLLCGLAVLVMLASGSGQQNAPQPSAPTTPQSSATPASQQNPQSAQKPPLKPVLAEDVYKNIQTFKGKQATRLLPAMLALRELLGVECTYCHTPPNWENEDKKAKQKARQHFDMIGYINHDHFADANKVSCWTCHHGEPKPAMLPPDPAFFR